MCSVFSFLLNFDNAGRHENQLTCDFHSGSAYTDLPDGAVAQEVTVFCVVGMLRQVMLSPVTCHLEPDLASYSKPRALEGVTEALEGVTEALEGVTEVQTKQGGISASLLFQGEMLLLLMSEVVSRKFFLEEKVMFLGHTLKSGV